MKDNSFLNREIIEKELMKLKKDIYRTTKSILVNEKMGGAYQDELKEYLKEEILNKFVIPWLKKFGITPTQGILYINSVVILYDGRIAVYFGDGWKEGDNEINNIKQEDWINRTIFGSEKAKMKFQNILSLCNKYNDKTNLFPVLVFGKSDLQYDHIKIEEYKLPIDLLEKPTKLWDKRNEIFSKQLKTTLQIFKDEFLKKYNIPIDSEGIDEEEYAKALILNPTRIATKYNAPNIFYIYDSRDIKEPGGIAFVAKVESSLEKSQIQKILETFQHCICDDILTPILIAESEALRSDLEKKAGKEPYVFRFFREELDDINMEIRIPLIDNIRNLDMKGNDSFSLIAKKVKNQLMKFFSNVIGPSGKAMRDYGAFSEEVFITTLHLWDDLMITKKQVSYDKNGDKIKGIDQFRVNINRDFKLLIHLLFTALNFEPAMKYIASYREHFIHCFHTFCFGFWLLCLKDQNNQYIFASNFPDRSLLLKSWFLAGMFHDIAIPIQKAGDYLQTLVKILVEQEELNLFPKWGDLMEERNFHELLFSDKFTELGDGIFAAEGEKPSYGLIRLNHKSVNLLLKKATHSVLGSLILYNNIIRYKSTYNDYNDLLSHVIMPVLVHHIWDEEWEEERREGGKKWRLQNFAKHPLAYLLILCDTISQLDRRFEDPIPEIESPTIKLNNLEDPSDDNKFCPTCDLVYDVSETGQARKYKQYYERPYEVISSGTNKILKVTLSFDLYNPTPLDSWTFMSP